MKLSEIAVKRPVTTTMLFCAILLIGIVAFTKLRIDMLPDIEPPVISVLTFYPGANATDVENDVTKYIEDQLSIVDNLDTITSISKDNFSLVSCKFDWGTNLDVAVNDIRDKLNIAKADLKTHAPDAKEPIIFKFSSSVAPIYIFTVTADESYTQLYRIVDKKIGDPLKRVKGVGALLIEGGLRRQISVKLDYNKLKYYNISILQISKILSANNINLPGGEIKMGRRAYQIRLPFRFKNIEEIKNIIVAVRQGIPIYLKDIAEVKDDFEEIIEEAWTEGKKTIVVLIQKQIGTNTVEVVRRIEEKLKEIKKNLPSDVKILPVINTAENIEKSIKNLKTSAYFGALMVVIITFLFLGNILSSSIIVTTIPFSLILGMIFLFLKGFTINLISLMSFTIAVGMVVDNAIVVTENITRHLELGEKGDIPFIKAPSEVGLAISASTLTTIVVFVPLMFVKGISGIIFGQLGFVVTLTLISSLFTALTLTPMLSSKIFKLDFKFNKKMSNYVSNKFKKLQSFYGKILDKALKHRFITLSICIIIFIISLTFIPKIGTEFLPEVDAGEIDIVAELPQDIRLEETKKVAYKVMKIYKKLVPERIASYVEIGQSKKGYKTALGFKEGINILTSGAKLISSELRERSAKEIAHQIRKKMEEIPEIKSFEVHAVSAFQRIFFGTGKSIVLEINGHNLEETYKLALKIKDIISKIPGCVDIKISQSEPRTELKLVVDREKASMLGVNMDTLALEVRANFYGIEATRYRDEDKDFPLFLRLKEKYRKNIDNILEISVPNIKGKMIKLKNIAYVKEKLGPIKIERKNRERVIRVEASTWKRSLGEVTKDIEKALKKIDIPPDVTITFGGEVKEQREAFQDMSLMLFLGICLVYMVMAGQFESFLQPFIIMFSIPFALVGVIWAFLLTGTTLSLMSFIGGIMLVGIVVNNAIVLIDYINLLRSQKVEFYTAIKEACKLRLRPILITTCTTLSGMVPMALSRAEGAEAWRPLGITIIGGLLISTLVTLIIVPTIYSILIRKK